MPHPPEFAQQVLYPGASARKLRGRRRLSFKNLRFGNIERVVLGVWLVLIAVGVGISLFHHRRAEVRPQRALDVFQGRSSDLEPKEYDPSKELRVALSGYGAGLALKPFVVTVRGPWRFGAAELDSVALALGQPAARGRGYLAYGMPDSQIGVTILFNAGKLDTIILAPMPCTPGKGPCRTWTLDRDQAREELLSSEPLKFEGSDASLLGSTMSGVYYAARDRGDWSTGREITGIYIQRLTKDVRNPPYVRGISARGGAKAAVDQAGTHDTDQYQRLLTQFEGALRLKEKVLGADHPSVHFLRFELGRMQAESGHVTEGQKVMAAALQPLVKSLGPEHQDVAAMRTWADAKNEATPTVP